MRGTTKRPGKRNLSGHLDEIDDYYAELEAGDLDEEDATPSTNDRIRLSTEEEVRRITAYVEHLRERVAELDSSQRPRSHTMTVDRSIFTAAAVLSVALAVFSWRLVRTPR